jgi:hypothetical protein
VSPPATERLSASMPAARRDPRLKWHVLGFAILAIALLFLLPHPVRNPTLSALFVALGAANLALAMVALRARRDAGAVLLDCGPVPQRAIATIGLAAAAALVLASLVAALFGRRMGTFDAAVVFFFGTHAVQALVTRSARLQLRERGLLLGTAFLPWARVRGWAWSSDASVSFVGDFPWLAGGEARLDLDACDPPREAIERVLAERVTTEAR